MVDELIYSELAKSLAAGGRFLLRGEHTAAYGFVYPALIAPAWALFDAIPQAYAAAKAINSFVVSLSAIPAYLLARRVLSPYYALGAAVLVMAVPTLLYSGMLMTENAFYPAFLLAALAMCMWLEKPDGKRLAFVLGAALLAYLTRAQAVAILPALAVAPFLVCGRRALREFRWFFVAGAGAVLLVVVVQLARGASVFGVFGAYEVAGTSSYTASGVSHWLLWHWEELILSFGIVPFAALIVLALTMRGRPRADRAFLATAVTLSFALVLEVATFASVHALRIEERTMVYVVPLFLIALMLWIERGCPRPPLIAVPAAIAAVALPVALPYTKLIGLPAVSDTPALVAIWSIAPHFGGIGNLRWVVLVAGLAICAVFLFVPRRYALVLPVLVFLYFGISQKPLEGKYRQTSILDLFQGITAPHPDWVDRAVGGDAQVTLIWSGNTDKYSVWLNEFFNRSVRHFYYTSSPLAGDLPEKPLTTDEQSGLMRGPDGKVVAPSTCSPTGRSTSAAGSSPRTSGRGSSCVGSTARCARSRGSTASTRRTPGRAAPSRTPGSAAAADRSLSSCRATRRSSRGRMTVTASTGERTTVGPTEVKKLRVPLRPDGRAVHGHVHGLADARPDEVTNGANPDPRVLGTHFTRVHLRAVRIAFDVSPLSHPRTGVGNYIRGSLARSRRGGRGRARDRPVRADEPAGQAGESLQELAGIPVEPRLRFLPFAHFWRQGWSRAGWPAVERFLGPFDVLHFTDWMYPPQRGGIRSTTIHDLVPLRFPEWTQGRTLRMHGAKYRNAARTCDLIFVNSRFTGRDVTELLGVPAEKIVVAYPGATPVEGEGVPISGARTCSRSRRSSRARTSRRLLAAPLPNGHALAIVGAEGWGPQPKLDRPGVIRLGYVDDAELARLYRGAAAFVYPSHFEGFGIPVVEAMASGVPVVVSSHPSLDEAAGDAAVRVDPDDPEAIGAASRTRSAAATSSSRAGLAHAARFTWRETGRVFLARLRDARRPRRLAARADAGGHGPLRRGLLRHNEVEYLPFASGTGRRVRRSATPCGTPRFRAQARGAGRAPLPDLSRALARRASRWSLRSTTSPSCATRRRSTAGRGATAASPFPGWPGGEARDRGVRVHQRRGRRAARCPSGAGARDPERDRSRVHPDGPAAEGEYVLAVGTLEPRKNLPIAQQATRWLAVPVRVVGREGGAASRSTTSRGSGLRRGARARCTAAPLRRLPVALRGLRHPDPRGDGLRDAGRDEQRRRDRGDRRRCRRARRSARPGLDRGWDRGGGRPPRRARPAGTCARAALPLGASRRARRARVYREAA